MAILTYKKKDTTRLSPNFKISEFSCKGRGCCDTTLIDEKLVKYLQQIRDHFGKTVRITSAYRCKKHNKSVNGATSSRHTKGQAADIKVTGVKPAEVAKYAESIGVKGIGLYETNKDGHFVHIDTRSTKSFWYGQAQAKRTTFGGAVETEKTVDKYTLEEFIKDVQKAVGTTVDGIVGPKTISKTVTLSAHENEKHPAVEAVQKRLKALGYDEVGTADGEAGPKFTSAVAHFQQDNGCVVDGVISAKGKTWKKLLQYN